MNDGPEWFAPKQFGVGSGLPIAWQGWALLIGYLAVVLGAAFLLGDRPVLLVSVVLMATVPFLFVTAKTTRGGWRWRWGERD